MKRPTIPDLARAAGVSVSTVNRVINDAEKVRAPTRERVLRAAQDIGFYGVGSIEHAIDSSLPQHRLGIILQQQGRLFYRNLGEALKQAAAQFAGARIDLRLVHLDDLSPDNVASHLTQLGASCEAVSVTAAEHPLVSASVDRVIAGGVPVAAMISPLSAQGNVSFIGLDNWKAGRTAGWVFDRMIRRPRELAVLVGNHRYRNQDLNEAGFRSYLREHNSGFRLLEPIATHESAAVAREVTEGLLDQHPDLCGIFVAGGGISGVVAALRERPKREDFAAIGFELFETTRTALIDGTLTMTLSHPMEAYARKVIETLVRLKQAGPGAGALNETMPFDIHTSENV